jgi:hypothetical protein
VIRVEHKKCKKISLNCKILSKFEKMGQFLVKMMKIGKSYFKTLKIVALKILIQSKFPHTNEFFNVFNFNSVE